MNGNNNNHIAIEAKNLFKSFAEPFGFKRFLKLPWELYLRLSGAYRKKSVLTDLSFKVDKGSVVGFLGPNGAGKSTTLKALLNLIRKDSGDGYILGYNMQSDYNEALKSTGALVELPVFYEFMSGYENLYITSKIYKRITAERIDEALKRVGLYDHRHKKVSQYSTGMRQKLYVAKILLTEASIIILDEPTSGMDPKGQAEMRDLIKSLSAEKNATILVSSHLLYEIEQVCDYVVIIKEGSVATYGRVCDLLQTEHDMYELEVAEYQNEKCVEFLKQKEYIVSAISTNRGITNFIELKIKKSCAHFAPKDLVTNGFEIYNFVRSRRSLENFFLEVTDSGNAKQ